MGFSTSNVVEEDVALEEVYPSPEKSGFRADLLIFDGDSISFKAAAANEKRSIVATHLSTGKKREFDNRTKFKEYLADIKEASGKTFDITEFTIEDKQTPGDIKFTLGAMKAMIMSVCERLNCSNYVVTMSGKDNFRLKLPLPIQYKSNRATMLRPLQLAEAREYLLRYHGATLSEGCEADDVQAMWQYRGYKEGKKYVAVSIDKDAKATPGWLFNPDKDKEPRFIDGLGELYRDENKDIRGHGRKFFYYQVLIGDSTDCYNPRDLAKNAQGKKPKYGEVAAFNDLKDCQTDKECWEVIVKRYNEWYPEPVIYQMHGKEGHEFAYKADWLHLLQMYVDCAHMQRWKGDRIDVKALLEKLDVNNN